jgi:hypothetical protein
MLNTTDNDNHTDAEALAVELVDPEGDGQWLSATVAHTALGIGSKTLYRRIERGQIRSRKNELGRIEVWVPAERIVWQQPAPVAAVSVSDTREIVASLVSALSDSHRQSEEYLERAIRAEMRAQELEDQLSLSRPGRQDDKPWWRRWLSAVYG